MKTRVFQALFRWTVPLLCAIIPFYACYEGIDAFGKVASKQNSSAVIMFTGDLMCLGGQQRVAKTKNTYDFSDSFSYVNQLFQCADLTIGNLETLISPSNQYTIKLKSIQNNPNCNAMPSYLEALYHTGFDVLVTANNHSLDGGLTGISETLEYLEAYGFHSVGTNTETNKKNFIICRVNDIAIAILSYTELINRRESLPKAECEAYVNCYSKEKIIADVKEAKEAGAEFIIAYNHWGKENTHEITMQQKEHAVEMAEAGVDLILGSHSHCLQPAEIIETTDDRRVLCMYSMGNFVSSMTKEINNDTIVLEIVLHKSDNGVFLGATGYYPMKVISYLESKRFVVVPVSKQLNGGRDTKELRKSRERIKKILGNQIQELIP